MLSNLLCLCYLISNTFAILGGDPIASNEDEAEKQIAVTSLTGSNQPFVYIEPICERSPQCRDFRCSAFSALNATNVFWSFKTCPDESCRFEPKRSNFTVDGLQVSSNITLNKLDSGILRCFANNSHGNTEDIQEVVPVNNTGQRFINLTTQSHEYSILPGLQELRVIWTITVQGNPPPVLDLRPNNETVLSFSEKYEYNISQSNQQHLIYLIINNVTSKDLYTKYYLSAKNEFESRIFNLTFNAFELQDDGIMVHELKENYSIVNCSARSVLPCHISWSLKNCSTSSTCGYKPINELKLNTTNIDLQCASFLRIESSTAGFLRCFANNSLSSKSSDRAINGIKGSIEILSDEILTDVDETTIRVEGEISKPLLLVCRASALNHTPEVQWAGPGFENNITDSRFTLNEMSDRLFSYQKTLQIPGIGTYNIGKYFCKTMLKNGTMEVKTIDIQLPGTKNWPYYAIAILLVTVFVISIFIGLKMRTYQKLEKEMEELNIAGLANFEKGALEHLNPNLTIDDQADLLPYDERYEFPTEKLKLGEQIGSGAFGVVVKAEATGVFEKEPVTTVAVKMVNRNIGDIYIKALASELKIMIHLGKHVNIVNLLGACTKNIGKRELLVIVEYCRFGNLKEYLLNHRHTFVDQINPETGKIDLNIGGETLGVNNPALTYVTPCFFNRFYEVVTTSSTSKEIEMKDFCQETPQVKDYFHYKGDYRNINKPVSTKDLLLWSFQVARGMEYLASRKVLHGDLAARNILLTDGNVVKICDFGLSKSMYRKDVYRRSGDEMLPVKWMAIEAITDKIFSVQSDVWSFGIALWEIFSLARTPYPGMEYSETFCEKLLDGYRMKSPQYATEEIYEIMLHCWDADPTERPSFSQLVQTIGSILDDKVREHYVDMNSGYVKMNALRFKQQHSDYLSMVGAPEFKMFSSPYRYVNVVKINDELNTYL